MNGMVSSIQQDSCVGAKGSTHDKGLAIRDVAPVNKRLAEAKDWAVPFIDSSCSRVQTSGGSVRTYFRKLETRLHFLRQRRYGRRARHASGDLWEDQDQRPRARLNTGDAKRALWAYQRRFPHGHWKTITLVAGLRQDAILAPFVIDGPLDGKIFRTYRTMSAPDARPR
jgi:hypothetical protein